MKGKDKKSRKESGPAKDECQVCMGTRWDYEAFEQLKCHTCEGTVHRNCYHPDFREKDRVKFKCDPCKKRSSKNRDRDAPRHVCTHCGVATGMMKEVANQQWMHVLCALTSTRTHLLSYHSLSFSVLPTPSTRAVPRQKRCGQCSNHSTPGLPCCIPDCKRHIHLTCVVEFASFEIKPNVYWAISTFGMLDLYEGSLQFRLSSNSAFPGLAMVPQKGSEYYLIVCKQHNENSTFLWCPCKQKKEEGMVECEGCNRWYHNGCIEGLICRACADNDIFTKNLKLPELIQQAVKVERMTQLDKQSIKFLDHFCFKLSESIEKVVSQNSFEVERYFLRQHLERQGKAGRDERSAGKDERSAGKEQRSAGKDERSAGKEEGSEAKEERSEAKEERSEGKIMEILHYLLRREYKEESEITSENMEEMLAELSGKGSKFEWSQEKIEKTEKNFKEFILAQLKSVQKDSIRDIRFKLADFAKLNHEPGRGLKAMAADIDHLTRLLAGSESWQSTHGHSQVKDHHSLLEFFSNSALPPEDIGDILQGIKRLLRVRNGVIDEKELQGIVFRRAEGLSEGKSKDLKTIHMSLLKGTKQRRLHESRREMLQNIENIFGEGRPEQKQRQRNTALNNGILIPTASPMFALETDSIEVEIVKRQYLKSFSPPDSFELGPALLTLSNLLRLDASTGALSQQERRDYQLLLNKYSYYQFFILEVHAFKQQLSFQGVTNGGVLRESLAAENSHGEEGESHRILRSQSHLKLEDKLEETLREWPASYEFTMKALGILREAARHQVKWTDNELEMLSTFFDSAMRRVEKLVEEGACSLKSGLVCQVREVARHLGREEKYLSYIETFNVYAEWKQELEENFREVEKVLEEPGRCGVLLESVDKKIEEIGLYSHRLDLSVEGRKLRVLRVWCLFSMKCLVGDRSTTITAVQSSKSLMEKIQYPKNEVRRDIQRLEQEARCLNCRIGRFLEKHKVVEMEFFEELRFVQKKMTLKEARELQKDLERSGLDVEIELNELKDELASACSLFNELDKYHPETKNLEVLAKLRRELLDSPFLVCTLAQYALFLQRYYHLKCLDSTEHVGKKQYLRLLNHGGPASVDLLNRTQSLYSTYKEIEAAQKQVLSSKLRPEHLLCPDLKKYRADLANDPAELSRVERYFSCYHKYKDQFSMYREERADVELFNQLANDLARVPINGSEVMGEISRMKRQLEEILRKTRHYLPPSDLHKNQYDYGSPFMKNILTKYQQVGMRCEAMQKFELIIETYGKISDLSRSIDIVNYKLFSNHCARLPQLRGNDEFYRKREEAFDRVYPDYFEATDPLIETGLALMEEGGYLIKRPQNVEKYLSILAEVHKKLYKWEKPELSRLNRDGDEPVPAISGFSSDELSEDSEEDLGADSLDDHDDLDDLAEEALLIDDDQNRARSPSDSKAGPNQELGEGQGEEQREEQGRSRKRARPRDVECLISDDDE